MRLRTLSHAAPLVAVVGLHATVARADYDVAAGCPTLEEWRQDAGLTGVGPAQVDVRIVREGDEHVGTIRLDDEPPREVRAPSCLTVARALATIARLRASSLPPPPAPTPTPPAPPAPSPSIEARAGEVQPAWRLRAGLGASLDTGLLGGPGVAFAGFGELEPPWPAWPVALRVGVEQSLPERGDIARATRTVARLDACPYVVRLGRLSAAPCARVDGGFVRVVGTGVQNPRSAVLGWAEVGALGRVAVEPSSAFRLGVEGGGFIPLFHHGVAAGPSAGQDLARAGARGGLFAAVSIR